MSIIEVNNLTITFGSLKAVDNFSFCADEGEILALVGPDGAGKTSIFKAVCGLAGYDAGEIRIAGNDIARDFQKVKPILGYMSQVFSHYTDLTVEENLYFYAGLFGLSREQFNQKKKILYEFSGLGPFCNRRAGDLSGGMKQKLALSCTLIHDPRALMLDEPTTGVDPLSRRQFWDILRKLKVYGSAIVVSTPYMDEVALADRAIFIHGGAKLAEGAPGELTQSFKGKVYRLSVQPTYEMMERLRQIEGLAFRRFGSLVHIYVGADQSIEDYSADLDRVGIKPQSIVSISPGLEDTFIQLMGK